MPYPFSVLARSSQDETWLLQVNAAFLRQVLSVCVFTRQRNSAAALTRRCLACPPVPPDRLADRLAASYSLYSQKVYSKEPSVARSERLMDVLADMVTEVLASELPAPRMPALLDLVWNKIAPLVPPAGRTPNVLGRLATYIMTTLGRGPGSQCPIDIMEFVIAVVKDSVRCFQLAQLPQLRNFAAGKALMQNYALDSVLSSELAGRAPSNVSTPPSSLVSSRSVCRPLAPRPLWR